MPDSADHHSTQRPGGTEPARARLFLSYANRDRHLGANIATRLTREGFQVYHFRHTDERGQQFLRQIQQAIREADGFVALISPHYLTSYWCGQESELALQRQRDLQGPEPTRLFLYVAEVAETPKADAGFLRNYDWFELAGDEADQQFTDLVRTLKRASFAAPQAFAPASQSRAAEPVSKVIVDATPAGQNQVGEPASEPVVFRNRDEELDLVVNGLSDAGGPHFWFITAPPKLGKSWFLRHVPVRLAAVSQEPTWVVNLLDLREEPAELRDDAALLFARLFSRLPLAFGREMATDTLVETARRISNSGHPYLCLLDTAGFLTPQAARRLRLWLSQVHQLIEEGRKSEVRLGFVVAARQLQEEWKGIVPDPRVSSPPFTEFTVDVVRQTLRDLAREHKRPFEDTWFHANAERVHHLTEGLPALLAKCLEWIVGEDFIGMARLEEASTFGRIARPHIEAEFLSLASLLSEDGNDAGLAGKHAALREALRVLVPYRLFTMSHLQYHIELDTRLQTALGPVGWGAEGLWDALSETALLQPVDEIWQVIYPPIRRLLYRYWFVSKDEQAAAHRAAREFYDRWGDGSASREQGVIVAQCLWHEAALLRLESPASMGESLLRSARELSEGFKATSYYTEAELRRYIARRLREDGELRGALADHHGLFDSIIEVVGPARRE